jgi:transporter family protein
MALWIVYALLAAVCAACVTLFAKIGLGGIDVVLATTVRAAVMALLLVAVCLATAKSRIGAAAVDRTALSWIVAGGVAGALSWLFYFLALRDGPAPAVAALDRCSVVLVLLGAAALLGERLTLGSAAGAVLVVLGAILMTLHAG